VRDGILPRGEHAPSIVRVVEGRDDDARSADIEVRVARRKIFRAEGARVRRPVRTQTSSRGEPTYVIGLLGARVTRHR
jgi:hypothetical protein